MYDLFSQYYAITIDREITINGIAGYKSNEYVYFTISMENKEAIVMEQTILAYYLLEVGYQNVALPIQNNNGEWITEFKNKDFMIVRVSMIQTNPKESHGLLLANFHRLLSTHTYEPRSISNYGKWKSLWIKKLTFFENKVAAEAKKHPSSYYRLVMDVLPYVIGISENSIQYIRESEREQRYGDSDQGTITFRRYETQLIDPIIWPSNLVFDHLSRDVAEYIRNSFLLDEEESVDKVYSFLEEYGSIQPFTPFSWRLIYARLLYPIHIFDLLENGLQSSVDSHYYKLQMIIEKQVQYEQRVKQLFQIVEENEKRLQIPQIQWLNA